MAYEKIGWVDGVTPLSATNLNAMEDGIEAAAADADDWSATKNGLYYKAGDTIRIENRVIDNVSYSTVCVGSISGGQKFVRFFIPTKPIVADTVTINTLALAIRVPYTDANGKVWGVYPWARYGTNGGSYLQIGNEPVTLWDNGGLPSGYSNLMSAPKLAIMDGGLACVLGFNFQLMKATGKTASSDAIPNNVPVSIEVGTLIAALSND